MVGAVQTATSTFGIWAIVVVAVVCLVVWLVGISVADNMQARESRRWWRRLHASQQALGSPEPAPGSAGSLDPFARPGNVRGSEWSAAGQEAADRQWAWDGQEAAADQDAVTEPIPAQGPAPESESESESETAAARGRQATPTIDGAAEFRTDGPEVDWRTEAPTRPDLPAQADPAGRHAVPTQRTGDTDRAERSFAGPDAARQDDDPEDRE